MSPSFLPSARALLGVLRRRCPSAFLSMKVPDLMDRWPLLDWLRSWVDPSNCIVVVFFSQVHGHRSRSHPPGTQHNYSDDLRVAVNAAIVDHPWGGGSGAGGSAPPRASFHRL
jgi:hypothetical protein